MKIAHLFKNFPSEEELITIIRITSSVLHRHLVEQDIERWLSNFKGDVFDIKYERLIAIWLFCHFTFYTQEEVNHLCKVVYRDLNHLILSSSRSIKGNHDQIIQRFFRYTKIITPEQIGGSGGFISYFFRNMNYIPMKAFAASIDDVKDNDKNVIIIDDVTLSSGNRGQMYRFWKKNLTKYPTKNFFLITLIAYKEAVETLKKDFNVNVICSTILDERDKCFWAESDAFAPFPKLIEPARIFASHYGKKAAHVHSLGYNDGQFTFGFFYNTPNNSLPIFWGTKNGWIPLVKRYDKNLGDTTYISNDRFI